MLNVKTTAKRLARRALSARTRELIHAYRHGSTDALPLMPDLVGRYCTGRGLEVGAGKTPYCDPSRTVFLDKNVGDKDSTENPDIVADADAIPVPDASYDYVFSSHVLEHMQNTIRTLHEWMRVLKPGGVMFVALPHAERTLDRYREITTLQHHIDDFGTLTDEPDRTHFEEMKAGWLQAPEVSAEQYRKEWGADIWDWEFRIKHSVIHFHVWTQNEIVALFQHVGLRIEYVNAKLPERGNTFVVIARKPA